MSRTARAPHRFGRRALLVSLPLGLAVTAAACGDKGGSSSEGESKEKGKASGNGGGDKKTITVYATTGYLADAMKSILGDAKITTMVGPGGDPHTYQPSTKDIQAMQDADLVLWNGLHLEAQMIDQLKSLGDKQLCVGEMLPKDLLLPWPEKDDQGNELHDPHIWNSPEAWSKCVGFIGERVAEMLPDRKDEVTKATEAYQGEIDKVYQTAKKQLESVNPRVLITGHDAFNYFGKTFDLEVYATDFVSTEAARNAAEISELAHVIAEKKVPVIFQDNQANPQAITSLKQAVEAAGWKVEISTKELFADSLGAEPEVDTYLEVFAHNATAVAKALGGKADVK